MSKKQPINAEVPAAKSPETPSDASTPSSDAPSSKTEKPQRKKSWPPPLGLRLIGAAAIVAALLVIVAVLGGGGEGEKAPAPAPEPSASQAPEGPAERASEELGYPTFATKNTTRVGGGDPASNAAGVALATFPSTAAAQRPDAVTLVGEDAWAQAIAASVLMAAPVGAPILIAGAEEAPEQTVEALSALAPPGAGATGGAQAFAIGDVATPSGLRTTRVQGRGPAAIAARIATLRDRLAGARPVHIVVAPLERPGFAMPAAAWAARSGDPVLFASRNRLPAPTAAALKRRPDIPVFVLGPSSAISPAVARGIAKTGHPVQRVSGEDPVSNAIAFARYDVGGFGWDINDPGHGFVVARDDSPLDAAAAAPLSAAGTWGPLLLTDNAGTLPAALRDYLLDVKPGYADDPTRAFYNHVWVIGDQEAIGVKQQGEIDGLAELARVGP